MSSFSCVVVFSFLIVIGLSFCLAEPNEEEMANTYPHCICKPTMRIEMVEHERTRPICNNATMNWLLNAALEQISKQSERMSEMLLEMKKMEEQLSEGHDPMTAREKEVPETCHEVVKLRSVVVDRDARIEELEAKLHLVEKEKDRLLREKENHGYGLHGETLKDGLQANGVKLHPRDCSDVQESGMKYSGIYMVYPDSSSPAGIEVFCDLNTDGGCWTVIQRRQDGSEPFERNWTDYKKGFGVLAKEFWLGNDNIHLISNQQTYELRIDMLDFNMNDYFVIYSTFLISDESDNYRLSLGQYSGNAGDSLSSHNGWPFSTIESDHDGSRSGNCSELYGGGGWWFARCYDANLNGRYTDEDTAKTVVWYRLPKNVLSSLRSTEMKIRPQQQTKFLIDDDV